MLRHVALTAAVFLFLPFLYVMSYAPVCWCMPTAESNGYVISPPCRHITAYRPVVWMIDRTPLRQPILMWADVWGVRERMVLRPIIF